MESFRQYEPLMNKISPDLNNEYHVFLSFRGPDVRKKFVDHLYESLTASGLRVFLDSEELEKGKAIDASLETAIEKSDILIPIFSQRYAESTWCLEEAVRMRKSEALIIPLFYDVEPSDVRYPRKERGKFKEAFEKHDSRSDRQSGSTIQNWEIALREISGLSGWTSEAESGYEAKLVKRVVKDVLNTLQKNAPLDVAKYPIGLETGIRQLVDLLDLSSTNRKVKVGIIGLGGLGKTTLAKAVYNKIQGGFKASCFLFNIGAAVQNGTTLEDLQRRILKDLVRFEGKVSSVDAGKVLMKDRLRGVPALIILDDVNDTSHLDALDGDWFGPGSRLIIISRDRHMPNLAKVNSIHEMSGLKETEALQLFSCHAFSKTVPENPYKGFSTSIVKACGGIPLALIVMGAHLCDKKDPNDIECWQEAVTNIVKFPGIFTVLRISYDGLSDIEKKIFLDIACCLVGEMINEPVIFWKALHPNEVHTAMKNLSLKMLINTSGVEDRLDMHVLVQQMGRRIQEELSNNSRVWQAPMGAGTHRDLNTDRSERVTMLVYKGENERESFSLQSMPSLQYLSLQNVVVVDNIRNLAPNLIWIKIRDCEFLSDSRTWRILRNRLQIDSWSQLRIFSLQHCASIKTIPNTLDSLVNLQRLSLASCPALTTLPKGLGNCLVNLQRLRVRHCSALATLPNTLGNLSRLEVLDLCGCASLTGLPDTVGNLKRLVYLCLGNCTGLKGLPRTIGNLSKLKFLNLLRCRGLSVLPNTMGNMAGLQFLNLLCCSSLQSLPYTLGKLAQVRLLSIQGCPGLGSFGDVVLKLASLRKLNRCTGLSNLTQKEINVYLSLPADEEPDPGDRLYESLPSRSLSICRGWDDDVSGEAISNSDIIVPLLGDNHISETWENRVKAMCASGSLTIPFCYDLPSGHFDSEVIDHDGLGEYWDIQLKSISGRMLYNIFYEGRNKKKLKQRKQKCSK